MKTPQKTLKSKPKSLTVSAPISQKEELLYERDFFKWTKMQAKHLKNLDFSHLDISHLIEEIESLGRSERRTLESYLEILLMHMLKVTYQPKKHTKSWDLSIKNSRQKFKKVLKQNPSLKPKLPDILTDAYESARLDAAVDTGLDETAFPVSCPWSLEEILNQS